MKKFKDYPDFKPNLTPQQVIKMGSFGGTYFRPIYSSVTKKHYKSEDVIKEFPNSWFKGINIEKMVTSSDYDKNVNKYKVKCGSKLEAWLQVNSKMTPHNITDLWEIDAVPLKFSDHGHIFLIFV